ncbi:hypothetical protein [Shewanella sp. NIFS-20-20]|uniref:hypothetical protein n=1 Tax=Shewanella sp. NIFS-20-20 TaxID=2853806 RepID=UPI001C46EEB5|nr:hypothetical protein [Shewanella sp. NIFS-20-20]MBV7315415.1 hypothetical protein [Shewanella sp. NIFS-20-20]
MNALKLMLGVWLGFALMSAEAMAECEGRWQLDFVTAAAQIDTNNDGVWIPAHLHLDRGVSTCAKQLIVRQPQGGPLQLQGQGTMANYQMMRANRQQLNHLGRDHHVMSLNGAQQYDLWVYIAQGKLLSPGRYQGMLDVKLAGGKLDQRGWQRHGFDYQVNPFVQVKLAGVQGGWLQPAGTSVRLHLGDLTRRNQRELPVYLESNTMVSMRVSSKNHGALVHVEQSQHQVPYQMLFAGQVIDLASEAQLVIAERAKTGKNVSLVFENQASPYARAGQYEDVVTVSIFAR